MEHNAINNVIRKMSFRGGRQFDTIQTPDSRDSIGTEDTFNINCCGHQVAIMNKMPGIMDELDVCMMMLVDESMFGFSVMGGYDMTNSAWVDNIISGSPADRADLEVGDEIVEVNGQSMEGCSHSEIISHIHKCIQSKQIKLRVRRGRPHTDSDPITSDIDSAYVIAVDEQARYRLDELSALHKVKAIDICKLQDFGNNNVDRCPVVEEAYHPSARDTWVKGHQPCSSQQQSEQQVDSDKDKESECGHDVVDTVLTDGCDAAADLDCKQRDQSSNGSVSIVMETAAIINGYQDSKYQLAGPVNGGFREAGMKYPMVNSTENVYEPVEMDELEYTEESGPHREMAIDCPASFVGVKKEPPRYPPHLGKKYASPHGTAPKTGWALPKGATDASYEAPKMSAEEEKIQLERIKMYQEDLKRRREEEERINREQEFLRTSLRGSKKLQSLEESHRETPVPPSGIINPNYVDEEETSLSTDIASKTSTLPVRQKSPEVVPHKPINKEVLLQQLQHFQRKLRSIDDQKDIAFLQDLFSNPRFQHAVSTYNKVAEVRLRNEKFVPYETNCAELSSQILSDLSKCPQSKLTLELKHILESRHVKSLLQCHDKVATQRSQPANNTTEDDEREYLYERASQYGDEIKIVRLQKTADPLGATVRNDGDRVIIGRIVKGGAAEKSGLLHEGDEILEINGIDIRGKSVNDVCTLMASLTGTLTFLIIPSLDQRPASSNETVMHIRAHFNYDPEEDLYIPCRELGISFAKGDILHVINQDDKNWWQAYREGEEDQSLAGLIPSKSFQEQKEAVKQTIVESMKESSKKKNKCRCTRRTHKKKKKQLYNAAGEELDAEEILTYEEVALYYPQPNRKRPIVLIGPPNVGRQELRQRLMESDSDRFAAAIPHTSRPIKDGEVNGKDYHFVDRAVFEQDIAEHKFVEYGEYEKNLYGTSLEAIREVVNSGKICVLNLYPQSLRVLKASDLRPYIVFIAPPNIEKLKQLRQKQGVKVTDSELIDIIEKAREMEENYGHYFDQIIMNYDLDRAYQELLTEIDKLEVEPQWVPAHWVT